MGAEEPLGVEPERLLGVELCDDDESKSDGWLLVVLALPELVLLPVLEELPVLERLLEESGCWRCGRLCGAA